MPSIRIGTRFVIILTLKTEQLQMIYSFNLSIGIFNAKNVH